MQILTNDKNQLSILKTQGVWVYVCIDREKTRETGTGQRERQDTQRYLLVIQISKGIR